MAGVGGGEDHRVLGQQGIFLTFHQSLERDHKPWTSARLRARLPRVVLAVGAEAPSQAPTGSGRVTPLPFEPTVNPLARRQHLGRSVLVEDHISGQ
jgi:hypothetical protein